jgi:hypothetical protein
LALLSHLIFPQEDVFYHDDMDMGDIKELEIGHDNSGVGPSWHLQEVIIFDLTANKRFAFPCDRLVSIRT